MGSGLATGIVFGGTLVVLTAHAAATPPRAAQLVTDVLDEVFSPSVARWVLFTAERVAAR